MATSEKGLLQRRRNESGDVTLMNERTQDVRAHLSQRQTGRVFRAPHGRLADAARRAAAALAARRRRRLRPVARLHRHLPPTRSLLLNHRQRRCRWNSKNKNKNNPNDDPRP